jgi:cell division protein FtsI (penicillin-binding protein 3)
VRADIVDRNGQVLATSIATASLFANPSKIIDGPDAARQLAKLFPDVPYSELLQKLQGKSKFVWLKRHLTPHQQDDVQQLGIPGIGFESDERRIYPENNDAAQVIGYADIDNKGTAGIEESFNDYLAKGTDPLRLSLDIRLQHVLRREVQIQIDTFHAIGGGGLIMDTKTGEILAMVSLPDFDPEHHGVPDKQQDPDEPSPYFNRMTKGVYEMGSIFKVFNTALALDSGRIKLTDYFDAAHPIKIGKYTIHDFKGDELPGYASVAKIFEVSSNIGSVREVQQVGPELQEQFMRRLGLTRKADLELTEVGLPEYPHPWRPINMMTIAFGHGIAVSPVQLVSAISAIANGGVLHKPTLIQRPVGFVPPGERVISEATSDTMRRLMRLVVTGGTAKKFGEVPGYLVGGKTGTAEKRGRHGGYVKRHANLSSFVGVFPMTDPRYAVFVTIDEPQGNKKSAGFETGGWVAAPAVARVIGAMGPMLGIPPVDDQSPIVQAKMEIDVNPVGRHVTPN